MEGFSLEFWLVTIVSLAMVANGLLRRSKIWAAPTWVGFIFVAYLLPQAIYIEKSEFSEAMNANNAWLYISFCLAAFWLSFELAARPVSSRAQRSELTRIDKTQLLVRGAIVLSLGLFSMVQLRSMNTESLGSQWTGIATAYYLLFSCIFLALCIAAIRFLKTREIEWLIFFGIALVIALASIASNAKRSLSAEIFFVIFISVYFVRRWIPPRAVILAFMVLGTVVVHQVGSIRAYIEDGRGTAFDAVREGVPFERFVYFNLERAPEMTQALSDIDLVNQTGEIVGPAPLWNKLVHQYVPAFLLGREFKESMKVEIAFGDDPMFETFDSKGATRTGFSDSYRAYGFLGFIMFVLIGWIMGWLFQRAMVGQEWAMFLYIGLLNDSMFAITEATSRFFSGGVFVALIALFLFLGVQRTIRRRRTAPPGALAQQTPVSRTY